MTCIVNSRKFIIFLSFLFAFLKINSVDSVFAANDCQIKDLNKSYCVNANKDKVVHIENVENPDFKLLKFLNNGYELSNVIFNSLSSSHNDFIFTAPNIINKVEGVVTYNNSCEAKINIYPLGQIETKIIESKNGCLDYSAGFTGVSDLKVVYKDSSNVGYVDNKITNQSGTATFIDVPTKHQYDSTCGSLAYNIHVNRAMIELAGYNVCENSLGKSKWNVLNDDIVLLTDPFDESNPVLKTTDLVLEKKTRDLSQITVEQGKLSEFNESQDNILKKIFEINADSIDEVTLHQNEDSEKCENLPTTGQNDILYLQNCDLEITRNNQISDHFKLVIIKNGDLTINNTITSINSSFVVENDVNILNYPLKINTGLNINGYLWAKGMLKTSRSINVNSEFEFLNNPFYQKILDSGIVHNIEVL